jgi:hypothetical protein
MTPTRSETCRICERVEFGPVVELGFGAWRHHHCAIGSQEWREYYHRVPETDRRRLREWYTLMYREEVSV